MKKSKRRRRAAARRYAPCARAKSSARVAKVWVRTPILGRFRHFLAILRKGVFSSRSNNTGPLRFKPLLCCAVVTPLAAYTHSIKSSDNHSRVLLVGFAERRAYFSHETGLLAPKHLTNFRCAGLRGGGCFAPHRRPEAYPGRHYHPRYFRKRSRCPGYAVPRVYTSMAGPVRSGSS